MSEHFVDPLDQTLRHDVLELFRLLVHLRPAHAHHVSRETAPRADAAEARGRRASHRRRQAHAAVRLVFCEPRFRSAFTIVVAVPGRDAERRRDVAHRDEPLSSTAPTGPDRSPSDSSRPCSTGASAGSILSQPMQRSSDQRSRRRGRRNARYVRDALCAPSRTGTTSSPWRPVVRAGSPVEAPPGRARGDPALGFSALDLATGTGDIAFALAARGARAAGLDLTPRMIELASSAKAMVPLRFLVGDMLALPFPAASFDIVTTGYGLRNVPDLTSGDRRDSPRAEAGRSAAVARFQPAVNGVVRIGVSGVSHSRRRDARLDAAPRSRHVPLHSCVDTAATRAPRRRPPARGAWLHAAHSTIRCSAASWPSIMPSEIDTTSGLARARSRRC